MANKIVSSLGFIETCGLPLDPLLRSVDFFTSHEGLHLESLLLPRVQQVSVMEHSS